MKGSKLGFSIGEFRKRYLPHLLLQEMGLLPEIAIYIMQLKLLHNREEVYTLYFSVQHKDKWTKQQISLQIRKLDDRAVNGALVYMLASCEHDENKYPFKKLKERYANAYALLSQKNEDSLSILELFCKADSCIKQLKATAESNAEYFRLLEICASRDYLPSFIMLHDFFMYVRDNREKALFYLEKGVILQCVKCIYTLASYLYSGVTGNRDLDRAQELYIHAAKLGHASAEFICEENRWAYLTTNT